MSATAEKLLQELTQLPFAEHEHVVSCLYDESEIAWGRNGMKRFDDGSRSLRTERRERSPAKSFLPKLESTDPQFRKSKWRNP